jgi:hypothetical protein
VAITPLFVSAREWTPPDEAPEHWGGTNSNQSAVSQAHRYAPVFALRLARLKASLNKILDRERNTQSVATPHLRSSPTSAPIEACEDRNELANSGGESRTRIEAIIGVGNEQTQ